MARSRKYHKLKRPKRPKTRKYHFRKPKKAKTRKRRRRAGVNSPKKKSPSPQKSPHTIKVTALTPNGDELTFHVVPQTTISQLKTMIEAQNGYDKDLQKLFDIEDGTEYGDTNQIIIPMNLAVVLNFKPIESNAKLKNLVGKWINNEDIEDIEAEYGSISNWDTSRITNMKELFWRARTFNEDISQWNVSNVNDMSYMFADATNFNQPLNDWDVSNVTDMSGMFEDAMNFNQPLNEWNVSNVNDMSYMFADATNFNQPLNEWNISNITNMSGMFEDAGSFNQDLSAWDVSNVRNKNNVFVNTPIENRPEYLPQGLI